MHPFFAIHEVDCCGWETIGLDVKLLMALKVNVYGVAANAFLDYVQMGESTVHKCCRCFNEVVTSSIKGGRRIYGRSVLCESKNIFAILMQVNWK